MFEQHLKDAILALVATSKTASEQDRLQIAHCLRGDPAHEVMDCKEVCARLGKSRQTVNNLIKVGLLTAVRGGLSGKYVTGITTDSFEKYIGGLS